MEKQQPRTAGAGANVRMIQTKTIPEVARLAREYDRPVRFGVTPMMRPPLRPRSRLEKQAQDWIIALANIQMDLFREWFEILPGPSFDATRANDRKWFLPANDKAIKAAIGDVNIKRYFDPSQMMDIEAEFWRLMENGIEVSAEMGDAATRARDRMVGPYNLATAAAVREIIRISWEWITRAANRSGVDLLTGQIDGAAIIRELEARGYNLVTSKLTKHFLPKAKQLINQGLSQGQSWAQIKSLLNRKIGVGSAWHWARLVRTEMTGAIDRINRDQYRAAGVNFVRYSAAPDRCKVCEGWARQDNGFGPGIYLVGNDPILPDQTHPLCRCLKIPIYQLGALR